ncbi:thiamine-monophosphate kinase [Kribbella flavida DSM 17836]|uniref:Thiamine-monophosphate kinase n=1 Tax=Kribbella flavida (strain DSM 17836 / JCM 10339 / NBRC 14399) TaxID=479435 RepID=D2Q0P3_KRIFD|nr:thiamine-phosphate kinase [Kribbella flavida]ADB33843.1 thiamine-monophosphate kinase [Kribbella flavida DSM 17836]
MTETLGSTGEFGLIAAVTKGFPQGEDVLVGPGDDAAVVAVPDGRMVITTDLLVEGRHFRRDWSSAYDVGRKAAAQNLADVVAMGARPTALVVGFGAPTDLPTAWAVELSQGLADEADLLGVSIVGGDTVQSDKVVVSVTAFGSLDGRRPVLRSGARPGDEVAVAGRLGWAEAGFAVLTRGFRSPRSVVDAHRRPQPPYAEGPRAAIAGASAMCDVSDGLIADLRHIAEASQVVIDVRSQALAVPEPLEAVAAATGLDALTFVLTGGEDHALVGTFEPADVPDGWTVVGSVAEGNQDLPAGTVTVDGAAYAAPAGHAHFAS